MLRKRVVIIGLVALGLGGCGRRGYLEAPPDAGSAGVNAAASTDPASGTLAGGLRKTDPGIQKPKRPFILDPLL